MTDAELQDLAVRCAAVTWRWAKTYAETAPHYYVTKWVDAALVADVRRAVKENGHKEEWKGRQYLYLHLAGWKYWAFLTLVNREPLPGTPWPAREEATTA